MAKYFVTAHVTVQESQEKAELNTPGGDVLMKRLGGSSALPFFAFLDANGEKTANSVGPKGDIGHPVKPHEVDWFVEMLAKAAPKMTADERTAIEKPLRAQKQ